jgi:PIN domain
VAEGHHETDSLDEAGVKALTLMLHIIPDTNVFGDDPNLVGEDWTLIREFIRSGGGKLIISQVVFDEMVNKFRERLTKEIQKAEGVSADISMLTGSEYGLKELSEDRETQNYSARLETKLRSLGAEILPYPSISHPELVARDLMRRKPFDKNGRGYRDSLIWVSVLQHATTKISERVLITKNSKDFAAGKDEKSLVHPDLLDDWQKAGKTAQIRLCATLSEFVNSFVKPTLQRLDNLKKDLAKGKTLNIQEYLMEHFQAVFEGVNSKLQLDSDEVPLEQPFGVTDLGHPEEIKLRDVLGLEAKK